MLHNFARTFLQHQGRFGQTNEDRCKNPKETHDPVNKEDARRCIDGFCDVAQYSTIVFLTGREYRRRAGDDHFELFIDDRNYHRQVLSSLSEVSALCNCRGSNGHGCWENLDLDIVFGRERTAA